MLDDCLDERKLDIGWIGYLDALATFLGVEFNGCVTENGKTELSLVTDYFHTVCTGRVMSHEAP